ncbi:MAG: hypothetical protein IT327_03430 [Anaerolineae bacterium]|nr:hypothetical protein [Anaerolineae bacterium]
MKDIAVSKSNEQRKTPGNKEISQFLNYIVAVSKVRQKRRLQGANFAL